MNTYVETSAVLAWLFGEPRGEDARMAIESASALIASDLTLLEIERALIRGAVEGRIATDEARAMRTWIAEQVADWTVVPLDRAVLTAARVRFPKEPVRTLDALHLGCVQVLRAAVPDLAVASLDERVRANTSLLGARVVP